MNPDIFQTAHVNGTGDQFFSLRRAMWRDIATLQRGFRNRLHFKERLKALTRPRSIKVAWAKMTSCKTRLQHKLNRDLSYPGLITKVRNLQYESCLTGHHVYNLTVFFVGTGLN